MSREQLKDEVKLEMHKMFPVSLCAFCILGSHEESTSKVFPILGFTGFGDRSASLNYKDVS